MTGGPCNRLVMPCDLSGDQLGFVCEGHQAEKWLVPLWHQFTAIYGNGNLPIAIAQFTAPYGFIGWLQLDIFVDRSIGWIPGLDEFTGVAWPAVFVPSQWMCIVQCCVCLWMFSKSPERSI